MHDLSRRGRSCGLSPGILNYQDVVKVEGSPFDGTASPPVGEPATAVSLTVNGGLFSGLLGVGQLPTTALVTRGASGATISGTFGGNGAGVTNLDSTQFTGPTYWTDFGYDENDPGLLTIVDSANPLSAGLSGTVKVIDPANRIEWSDVIVWNLR